MAALILRMAGENPSWGYTRLQRALSDLDNKVGRGMVANILAGHGIDPAPLLGKRTTWSTFLKAHWKIVLVSDFFTVEVWRLHGLTTYYVLFVVELSTRIVKAVGLTTNSDTAWMLHVGRSLLDTIDGILATKRKLIIDRDTTCCTDFRALFTNAGCDIIRPSPRSPNLNVYAERFVGSIKVKCLDRLILFGEASLRRAIRESLSQCEHERTHQAMGNKFLDAAANELAFASNQRVARRSRLGGVLNYYHREAA